MPAPVLEKVAQLIRGIIVQEEVYYSPADICLLIVRQDSSRPRRFASGRAAGYLSLRMMGRPLLSPSTMIFEFGLFDSSWATSIAFHLSS